MAFIVGLTGELCAGKDTFAEYLVNSRGFIHISLSDILREDLRRQGMPVTRENLVWLGNDLRLKLGGGVLSERALSKALDGRNYIITSIGTVEEIAALHRHPRFRLVFLDAPEQRRYEWFSARKREEEKTNLEEFQKLQHKERTGGGAKFRETDNCKREADLIISNDGTKEELYTKIDAALRQFDERPDWDEYFFGIMDAIAKRATCDRGKAAAVIVKDKMILATGYVGSPKGLPHCDEAGHLFEKTVHADGEKWHCVRTTHAEQNAIAQAAKHGIAIDGSAIYVGMEPCLSCAKMIINSGIRKVICRRRYHAAELTRQFFSEAGVELVVKEDSVEQYGKQ